MQKVSSLVLSFMGVGFILLGQLAPLPFSSQGEALATTSEPDLSMKTTTILSPALFNLEGLPPLPAPKRPQPLPVDFGAPLKAFTITGHMVSDGRVILLLTDGQTHRRVPQGGDVSGFLFTGTDGEQAQFQKAGETYSLPLPTSPN